MCSSMFGQSLERMRSVSLIRLEFVKSTRFVKADLLFALLADISLTSHCGYMRAAFIGESRLLAHFTISRNSGCHHASSSSFALPAAFSPFPFPFDPSTSPYTSLTLILLVLDVNSA